MTSYLWSGPNNFSNTSQCVDVSDAGTYTVKITNSNGCYSICQRELTPICTTPPNAGTNGTLKICAASTVTAEQLFAALGGNPDAGGSWSPTLAGAGIYTYTVAATAPCTEPATSTVTVSEQARPNAGTNGTLKICAGSTVTAQQLFAALGGTPDAGGSWSPTLAGAGIYTYTVAATAPCTEPATSTVTVSEQARPNAGTNGTLTVCAGTTITEAMLFARLSGSPATGGTWSGPVGGVYTYTVKATAPCTQDATSTVTVTFNPLPSCSITNTTNSGSHNAGVGQSVTFTGPSGYNYNWTFSSNTAGATFSGGATTATTQSVTVTTTTAGSYTLSLKVTDKTTYCYSTCTYSMNIVNGYYTVTQGFYGNVGGKICTPSGGLFTAGAKGNEAGLIALSINNMTATGQKLKLGITPVTVTATSRTFIMGSSTTEVNNLIKYLPATQTATVITANTGTNNNTDMVSNWPKLNSKKISDVLLGQAITLALNVYIPGNNLKDFVLKTGYLTTQKADLSTCPVTKVLSCSKDASTISSVQITTNAGLKAWINASPRTVMDLLNLASNALGGINIATYTGQSGITLSDINNAIDVINNSFDGGRFFLGYYTTQQSCSTLPSSAIASVLPNTSKQLSVKAYPNPFLTTVNFNFTSPVSGKAVLEAYDLLGKKLAVVYSGDVKAGAVISVKYNVPAGRTGPVIYKLNVGDKGTHGTLIPLK
jgi:hypothetical protein